ncbi:ATP synthase subunit d, mitochondrial [Hyalella azteca]|uniref:ATP synthase subunit d, mitochondrial n=1 Tax=Hyalella azteca TaxID=294128 RepID=A0A8B7NXR8_HYAAZ|nr:ATP synthase subunit d, mitochondrial [Hyalella azteca]
MKNPFYRVASLPKDLPAINWTQYEGRVSVPNMVAEFQKQYQALTVPYPKDVYTSKIDEQEKATMIAVEEFVKKMQASVVSMKAELAKVEAMMPITEMNLEEYFDAFPNHALDSFERPTMWPHIEECQPEYLERMAKEGKFDEAH